MMRPLFVVVTVVACVLAADAHAQMTEADLVTRLGRLESTIRELTGRIEQLQYRNQQLEQQVQRLQQEEAARGEEVRGPARPGVAARPAGQYPQSTYSPPPANPPVVSSTGVVSADREPAARRRPPRRRVRSLRQSERTRRAANAWNQHGRE